MYDLTSAEFARLNELSEAEAWANYCLCVSPEFARDFRLEVKSIGSVKVTAIPDFDLNIFNRIIGLGIGSPATETVLDQSIALLRDAGAKTLCVQLSPLAEPAPLTDWLRARGFTHGTNWAKLMRDNAPAPAVQTDLRVESIGVEYAEILTGVAITAFGMPPELRPLVGGCVGKPGWHHYLGFDEEQPVSAAAMFVSGGVGWLGLGSTLESHRKRGGQAAMFARRIQDGLDLGCKWFITEAAEDTPESPNPSYHNMLRAGFRLAYLRPNYVLKPQTS